MTVLERLVKVVTETASRLDNVVERGYNLSRWEDQMMLLHALQVQAQALIDLALRVSSLLGYPPSTPVEAARRLHELGVLDRNDYTLLRRVIGFRNVIVHEYVSVDLGIVDAILSRREYRRLVELAEKIYAEARRRGLDP